jgi:methyl-accepting chemotaxis protein
MGTRMKKLLDSLRAAWNTINGRLSYRLAFYMLVAYLLLSLVIYWFISNLTSSLHAAQIQGVEQRGLSLARNLANNARFGVLTGDTVILRQNVNELKNENIAYAVFYNADDEVIYQEYGLPLQAQDFEFPSVPDNAPEEPRTQEVFAGGELRFQDFWYPVKIGIGEADSSPAPGPLNFEFPGAPAAEPEPKAPETAAGATEASAPPPAPGEEFSPGPPRSPPSPAAGPAAAPAKPAKRMGAIRLGISTQSYFDQSRRNRLKALGIILFIFVTGFFIILLFNRVLVGPVALMARAAKRVSQGELDVTVEVPFSDELGSLGQAFNEMTRSIKQQIDRSKLLVENIANTITLLSQTTDNLYSISSQQASGATEQAASVYEASSTSKEIAASATRIAESSEEVTKIADTTRRVSEDGKSYLQNAIAQMQEVKGKVNQVAQRMVELGEQSQKIGGVIDIINEISEQTNLLALNAAIEAAGAGEAGRRFSVVAAEIRRLAGRTLEATQVVRELIEQVQHATNSTVLVTEESLKASDKSAEAVDQMRDYFGHILSQVENTHRAATEINLSTRQQTTACEQMVATVMEVSEVANEVERGARETEQVLSDLKTLANRLQELTGERSVF